MKFYKVHNLHEDRPGNWIEYWENATGQKAGLCHSVDCQDFPTEEATDGAHVHKMPLWGLNGHARHKWNEMPFRLISSRGMYILWQRLFGCSILGII